MLLVIEISKAGHCLMAVFSKVRINAHLRRWYHLLISTWLLVNVPQLFYQYFSNQPRTSALSIAYCALSQAFYFYSTLCSSLPMRQLPTGVQYNQECNADVRGDSIQERRSQEWTIHQTLVTKSARSQVPESLYPPLTGEPLVRKIS